MKSLAFHPSPSLSPLLSFPSLALQIEPPLPSSSLLDGLNAFFGCPNNAAAFLSSDIEESIAADILSSLHDCPADPIHTNNLHALRFRDGFTLALFFPTGPNANSIGYLALSFEGGNPEVRVAPDGGIFKQTEGFKHPYQQIFEMVLSPASKFNPELSSNSSMEGFLLATTMYSVNWFIIETKASNSDDQARQPLRPLLVPVANQGFDSSVVHACWSPHSPEECTVLLKNGDLCWFNLNTKGCDTARVTLGDSNPGEWLSCEFGRQPWIVIVACSNAVVLVDRRLKTDTAPNFLARIDMLDLYCSSPALDKNDQFIAFCKSSFSDFYHAVVSNNHLFLFDSREPLVPVLTWDHGMEQPSYVAMFRLSELRQPSDEFKWPSDSGFAILVGSLWNNEFNLFCYGPKEGGALNGSSMCKWELPSCLPLSGRLHCSREELHDDTVKEHTNNVMAGFYVIPNNLSTLRSKENGFSLIRLMLSGKLEMQNYHASCDPCTCISNPLDMHVNQSKKQKAYPNSLSCDLIEQRKKLKCSSSVSSSFTSDTSVPPRTEMQVFLES